MKKIVFNIIIILCCQFTFAQAVIDDDFLDVIATNAKPLWEQSTSAFNSNTVPEKYKKESAVIFGFKRELSIDKTSKAGFLRKGERSLVFYENVRFKIKLQDRNSVKVFTEFYFRYSDKEDGFSAKVTKKDGITSTISLADAVRVERVSEVPEFFKSFFDQELDAQNRYYKVAIPDLESGDILEYVTITKSKLNVRGNGLIEFSPQYELCAKNYPILFNQIAIETDDKSYFKSLSRNGAPDFKKEASNNAEFFRYVFTDNDRATEKDVNFVNSYKQFPFTKFQVIYSNNENAKGTLMGNKGEIKSSFTKEELAKKAWEDFNSIGKEYSLSGYPVQQVADALYKELKKLGAKDWSEKEYIKNSYYRLRNYVLNRNNYLSDKVAAFIFSTLLYQQDIKTELVIAVSNTIGEFKDILFDDEIRYVTKVGNDLYFNVTDHSNPGELNLSLLGSDGYIIEEPNKKTGEQVIKPFKLPNATFAENSTKYINEVSLNADMSALAVKRVSTYKGINKTRNISSALQYTTYMLNDYKNYDGDDPTDKMKSKELEQYEDAVKALKDEYKESKPEYVKKQLQSDFEKKVVVKNFVIDSDGRSIKKSNLIFTEEFEVQNMTRKAGKKILVNLAGLVGSQLQFKKEERDRKNDIDVDNARSIEWVISFKAPAGYTVEGLKEHNKKIDNEIGLFESVATEVNGVITLVIKKVYKKATFSKAKWSEMLEFIDAAYNNSFKNILLKPKS